MSLMGYDVIIVGAGPAGSTAAAETTYRNLKVMIAEEHMDPGNPPHCAGILHDPDLTKYGIKVPDKVVQAKVKNINLHLPGGLEAGFRDHFTVIDRPAFDRHLFNEAADKGVEFLLNSPVTQIIKHKGYVEVFLKEGRIRRRLTASMVIGADGYRSKVGLQMGLKIDHDLAYCMQYEVSPNPLDSNDVMSIYLGEYAPGGYAWVVPAGKDKARIGLGVRNAIYPVKKYMNKFFRDVASGSKILREMGHCVPLGGTLKKFFGERTLLVGDAAGHVVPSSGAGVAASIVSARLAAETAVEALQKGDVDDQILSKYQDKWSRALGGKFKVCMRLKNFLDGMTENTAGDFMDLFKNPKIRELILEGKYVQAAIRITVKKPWTIRYVPLAYRLKKYGVF